MGRSVRIQFPEAVYHIFPVGREQRILSRPSLEVLFQEIGFYEMEKWNRIVKNPKRAR